MLSYSNRLFSLLFNHLEQNIIDIGIILIFVRIFDWKSLSIKTHIYFESKYNEFKKFLYIKFILAIIKILIFKSISG